MILPKEYIRCAKFEMKHGKGSINRFIELVNKNKTMKEIASEFDITVIQAFRLYHTFCEVTVTPSDWVIRYHKVKGSMEELVVAKTEILKLYSNG